MPSPSTKLSRRRKAFTLGVFALGGALAVVMASKAAPPGAPLDTPSGTPSSTPSSAPSGVYGPAPVNNVAAPSGHNNLTLDESGLRTDGRRLTFGILEQWDYTPDRPPPPPEVLRLVDGREQELNGFMFPLESGPAIQYFCLLRTTQTCCYGPMPQFNQYVLVEMDRPVRPVLAKPVTVTGRFHVDPQPGDGYIYRMEGVDVKETPAGALRVIAQ